MRRYKNSTRVLPRELLDEIRKHVSGCYLWVPTLATDERSRRDAEILQCYRDEGLNAREIAERFYLKPRRVRQILAKARSAEKRTAIVTDRVCP